MNGRKQLGGLQHPQALTKTQQRKLAVIEGSSGNILTENTAVLNRCTGLYNYELIQTQAYSKVTIFPDKTFRKPTCAEIRG